MLIESISTKRNRSLNTYKNLFNKSKFSSYPLQNYEIINNSTIFNLKQHSTLQNSYFDNKISFGFNAIPAKNLEYTKFINNLQKKYPKISLSAFLTKIISDKNNLLGVGSMGGVYKIPQVNHYAIKVFHKNKFKNDASYIIKPVFDSFPHHNFGQPIAEVDNYFQILKLVNGYEYGISGHVEKGLQKTDITVQDSIDFLNQMKIIANFKQKSYIDFANDIKILNRNKSYRMDFQNPNNIMIDEKRQKISIIDLSNMDLCPWHKQFQDDANSMIYSLLDGMCYMRIYEKLPADKIIDFTNTSKIIVKKCLLTAKKVGLETNAPPASRFEYLEKFFLKIGSILEKTKLAENYNNFTSFYKANLIQ